MTRILVLIVGLGIAAAALFVLANGRPTQPAVPGQNQEARPPLDEIDADSRARLDRVLREADERGDP